MTDASIENENTIVHPKIKELTNNLALLLQRHEKIFLNGTPEQQLEKVLIHADELIETSGTHVLVNADLPLKSFLGVN